MFLRLTMTIPRYVSCVDLWMVLLQGSVDSTLQGNVNTGDKKQNAGSRE